MGTRSKPFYRIVVIDESSARNARTIEIIGNYDPHKEPSSFEVKKERAEYWLSKGAQPSDVVRKYLGKAGILPALNFDKKKKKLSKEEAKAKKDAETAEATKKAEEKKAKKEADKKAAEEAKKQATENEPKEVLPEATTTA
jgi:small subunit ribosomal protein S16